jgi:hypothetical protein
MGRIRPMAAVPPAWRPASGARGGLLGSRPTVEAARPASVWPVAERPGAVRTGCAVTTRTAREVARPATTHRWTGCGKVGSASTLVHPSGGST